MSKPRKVGKYITFTTFYFVRAWMKYNGITWVMAQAWKYIRMYLTHSTKMEEVGLNQSNISLAIRSMSNKSTKATVTN